MTQKTWDVVVVGGANYDYWVRGAQIPKVGDTVQGNEFQEAPGGKGANQALAAARLGARVAFVARIGTDACGERIMANLAAEGVDTSHVVRDAQVQTGVALIHVAENGAKQIMAFPGANQHLSVADIQQASALLQETYVLLTQLETPIESVVAAARLSHAAGAMILLDPAPPPVQADTSSNQLLAELLRFVTVIKPNAREAELLTGVPVRDRDSARQAAQQLLAQGVGAVAVQAGDEGNLLVWPEGEEWLPKLPVASIDATGAGDAFAAALAVTLAEGRTLSEAATFANAAAALKTTKLGAQAGLPQRKEVVALLIQVESDASAKTSDDDELIPMEGDIHE